jgi:hypothetical protein
LGGATNWRCYYCAHRRRHEEDCSEGPGEIGRSQGRQADVRGSSKTHRRRAEGSMGRVEEEEEGSIGDLTRAAAEIIRN